MIVWHHGLRQRYTLQFTQHNSLKSENIKWNKFEWQAMFAWPPKFSLHMYTQRKAERGSVFYTPVSFPWTLSCLGSFCPKGVYLRSAVMFVCAPKWFRNYQRKRCRKKNAPFKERLITLHTSCTSKSYLPPLASAVNLCILSYVQTIFTYFTC